MLSPWRRKVRIETERMVLRLPEHADFNAWSALRAASRDFLTPWEPVWARDHLTRRNFTNRVLWARHSSRRSLAYPFVMLSRDGRFLGAITLDNIRRGPSDQASLGYWIGADFARQGFMSEAIKAVRQYAFDEIGLSRIEAACLPENLPSRGALEKADFRYEGVAQAYLQINGRWRNHVLYASLRADRRGKPQG